MKYFKQIFAFILVICIVVTMAACNKDDEITLTTKRRTTKAASTSPEIDINAFLNEGNELDIDASGEEVGTFPSNIGGGGSSSTPITPSYQDVAIDFGGSNIIAPATTAAGGYPTFHWNAVPGAIKYNIYRATTKSGTYSYIDSTTNTSYVDKTAIKGRTYFYQVKAVKKSTTTTTTKKPGSTSTTNSLIPTKATVTVTTRDTSNAPTKAPYNFVSIKDIVSLYNASANNVKTNAISVTRQLREIKYIEDENNSETIKTLLNLGGVKENTDTKPQSFIERDKIISEFPAEDLEVSSTLDPSMVQTASCTYSGGYYTVTIVLKNDPEKTTEYSGTCMNILNAAKVYSAFKAETRGAKITAKIYYTGSMDYLDQYMPTYVYADYDGNDMSVHGQQALSIRERWYIAY